VENKTLRIGRIPYANLFPTYHYLDTRCNADNYVFIEGVPSTLNRLLREGKLDISPSSSIEYLRNQNDYSILPWFSVSSTGSIGSILLFSKLPITDLDGHTIAVSSDSESSVALLKIILKEFYSLNCGFSSIKFRSADEYLPDFSAVLLIGDDAMIEAKKQSNIKNQSNADRAVTSKDAGPVPKRAFHDSFPHIYDLGDIWFKHTGLPFVFALWIARKQPLSQKTGLIEKLSTDLIHAKKYASQKHSLIASRAPQKKWLKEEELVDYWKNISYDFTERHLEGLRLFEKHSLKNNLIF
jgi:chorismate dehydratase